CFFVNRQCTTPSFIFFPYTTLFRSHVVDDQKRVSQVSLIDHYVELSNKIKETKARLCIIDPFNAYLPSRKVDTFKDQDVRGVLRDRKSTRLNSSHGSISYAVFCLKK